MALEMEYLLSSDEMQSQRSTVLPPIPAMEAMSSMEPISAEAHDPHDAGEVGQEPLKKTSGDHPGVINLGVMFIWLPSGYVKIAIENGQL